MQMKCFVTFISRQAISVGHLEIKTSCCCVALELNCIRKSAYVCYV